MTLRLGVDNLAAGILASRGRYRAWLVLNGTFLPGWPGLASLYWGVAFTLMAAGPRVLGHAPAVLQLIHFFVLFPSLVGGIIAMF